MLARYMVVGWSPRLGMDIKELFECRNMEAAKQRFLTRYPTLKEIRVFVLRSE